MTTIAYCNGVMASDSSLTYKDEWVGNVQKVWKFDTGCLYGARGEGDDRALRKLLSKVKTPDDIPTAETLMEIENDVTAMFVFPSGEVWHVRSGKVCAEAMKVERPYHAIGSGRKSALGAMHALRVSGCPCTAETFVRVAIEAAIEEDLHTAGEIQIVKLDPGIQVSFNFHRGDPR